MVGVAGRQGVGGFDEPFVTGHVGGQGNLLYVRVENTRLVLAGAVVPAVVAAQQYVLFSMSGRRWNSLHWH